MKIRLHYRQWIQFLLLLAIEFDLPRVGFFSVRKMAFLLLLFYFIRQSEMGVRISEKLLSTAIRISWLFAYTVGLLSIQIDDISQIPEGCFGLIHIVGLFLMLVLYPMLFRGIFRDVTEFTICQWRVILFQALIVLAGCVFDPIRMFVFMNMAYGDGRLLNNVQIGIRSVGIDLAGAAGSMILFAGIMCGVYLFYQSKDRKEKRNIILGWLCIMAALLFVGRTGLCFGGIVILGVLIHRLCQKDKSVRWLVLGMAMISCGVVAYAMLNPDSRWVWWIAELSNLFADNKTVDIMLNMNIPGLTLETFFGTGMVSGPTASGLVLNHDAGYVQTYTGIGVIGATMYYGLIYCFYFMLISKVKLSRNKWIYRAFLLVLVIAEVKEPFLRKTPLMLILSTMLILETDFGKRRNLMDRLQPGAKLLQKGDTLMT